MSLDGILDMDASGSDLVFLAARRGQKDNRFSPDGVIGWRASVVKDGLDYIPFFISSSGPRASNMDRCGSMSPGKVRYLRDGSYLFVPGVEPGVFLYSSESLLKKTWDTAELGIDAECHLTKEASMRYSLDEPRRHKEWLARRRILDEIMPFPKGPGLVVRRREDGLTRWRVTTLRASGEFTHEELPIVSRSHYARVRGDVREDGAIVYLVRDPDLDRDDPERPIYLFVSKEVLDVKAAAEPAESPRPPGD